MRRQLFPIFALIDAMVIRELCGVPIENSPALTEIAREFAATRQRISEIETRANQLISSKDPESDDTA